MNIETYKRGAFHVVKIVRLTVGSAAEVAIEFAVRQQLENGATAIALVFDGDATPHSRVVALVAKCCRQASGAGAKVCVVAPDSDLAATFQTVGMDQVLEIYPDERYLDREDGNSRG